MCGSGAEWAVMLRVWEKSGERLRAALARFSGKKQERARSARRAGRGEVGGAAPVRKIGQGGFYAKIEWAGMLRVWERCRVVDDAAPVRKIGQRGFCGQDRMGEEAVRAGAVQSGR